MGLKIYNTLTRKIEEFKPNVEGKVKMYTCGPTVYHFAHIGNLRSYLMEDVLERTLKYLGYDVLRAMNITDVGHLTNDSDDGDDKMLLGAKREHKTVLEIAKFYTEAFKKDCEKLNILWPKIVVPATSCIDTYINMIQNLLDNGYAYIAEGNVYFDINKFSKYYELSNRQKEDMMVGVRDGVDEDLSKHNPADFALWFTKSKFADQELKWDSPWGKGYPGWHIECSGISTKYLGEYLDIHCGGVDNIFPHHTNEIAQSESFLGHKWCNYWFHVQHLITEGGKMSKSSGEFTTVSTLEEKGYNPLVYRLYALQSHYRKQLLFSYERLDNAKTTYTKLISKIKEIKDNLSGEIEISQMKEYQEPFKKSLEDDLNTACALATLYDVIKSSLSNVSKIALIKEFDTVLGLDLLAEKNIDIDEDFEKYILSKIEERKTAKSQKNYALADQIRDELKSKGVELIDTPNGATYKIK